MKLFKMLTSLGEKKAGTKECERAREAITTYLQETFPSLTSEKAIRLENFPLKITTNQRARIKLENEFIDCHLYDNTGIAGSSAVAKIYYAGYFLWPWEKRLATGKILVFKHNPIFHRLAQVYIGLKFAKCKAIILLSRLDNCIQRGLGYPYLLGNCPIPVIGLKKEEWKRIKRHEKLQISYHTDLVEGLGTNVILDIINDSSIQDSSIHGTKKNLIILGAHYDSWYEGAQDNCVAVQLLVDILAELQKERLKNHDLRCIFFDAEESGVMGSKYHVSTHNYKDSYEQIMFLNLEMPIPTKKSKFKILFYDNHSFIRNNLSFKDLLKLRIFPFPLRIYYALFRFMPADIDFFRRDGIPCVCTYCSNSYIHTPLDNSEEIYWEKYDDIKNYLVKFIKRVDSKASIK